MNARPILIIAVEAFGAIALAASPGNAGNFGNGFHGGKVVVRGGGGGDHCHHGGGTHIKIWNNNVNINKNWNINNNINVNKNLNINRNIIIAKSNSISVAVSGGSSAPGNSSSGSYAETTVLNHGDEGSANVEGTCQMTEGSVVKAIHAACVSAEGREFPASHMRPESWIDSSYEGEVARCIAGSTLKVTIGDVTETDQGMAGTYDNGEVLACGRGESLWHYKNGMVKCGPALPVKDCTERTNLRRYGTGDFFFSYRGNVCVSRVAKARSVDLSSTTWDGGVGDGGN